MGRKTKLISSISGKNSIYTNYNLNNSVQSFIRYRFLFNRINYVMKRTKINYKKTNVRLLIVVSLALKLLLQTVFVHEI